MRQADINRVNRAKEHLKAAVTQLNSIKWENQSITEETFIKNAKDDIRGADAHLDDIITINKK